MKKLRAADSADAIVDGLLRRRAAVYVPSSLRPLSVLTSRCRAASSASSSARSAATRSPKRSTPRLARTTRGRRGGRCPSWWPKRSPTTRPPSGASAASRSQTPTSAASFSNSTHAAAPSSSSLPTRADSSSRDPQGTDNERAAPNRYETKHPGGRPPDARNGREPVVRSHCYFSKKQKTGTEGEATVELPLPDRGAIAFILRQARAAPSLRRRSSTPTAGAPARALPRKRWSAYATIARSCCAEHDREA
jgi:hypothetical protein